jgi:hypothetical protein
MAVEPKEKKMIDVCVIARQPDRRYFSGKVDLKLPALPRKGDWLDIDDTDGTTRTYEIVQVVFGAEARGVDLWVVDKGPCWEAKTSLIEKYESS